jgi:hypothetical protein
VDPDDASSGSDLFLRTDYRVSCTSNRYHFAFYWAIASIFIYPIALPLYYLHVLYSAKHVIISRDDPPISKEDAARKSAVLLPLVTLYHPFKPHLWYFELIDILHRLFLTGVLTVIAQGSATQVLVGYLLIIFFKKIYEYVQPYEDPAIGSLKEVTMWQVYAIMLMALLIRLEFVAYDNPVLSAIMTLAVFGNIIFEVVGVGVRWVWGSEWMARCRGKLGSNSIELSDSANPVIKGDGTGRELLDRDVSEPTEKQLASEQDEDYTGRKSQDGGGEKSEEGRRNKHHKEEEVDEEVGAMGASSMSMGGMSAFDITLDDL